MTKLPKIFRMTFFLTAGILLVVTTLFDRRVDPDSRSVCQASQGKTDGKSTLWRLDDPRFRSGLEDLATRYLSDLRRRPDLLPQIDFYESVVRKGLDRLSSSKLVTFPHGHRIGENEALLLSLRTGPEPEIDEAVAFLRELSDGDGATGESPLYFSTVSLSASQSQVFPLLKGNPLNHAFLFTGDGNGSIEAVRPSVMKDRMEPLFSLLGVSFLWTIFLFPLGEGGTFSSPFFSNEVDLLRRFFLSLCHPTGPFPLLRLSGFSFFHPLLNRKTGFTAVKSTVILRN